LEVNVAGIMLEKNGEQMLCQVVELMVS